MDMYCVLRLSLSRVTMNTRGFETLIQVCWSFEILVRVASAERVM